MNNFDVTSPFDSSIAFCSLQFDPQANYQLHPEELKILSPQAVALRRQQFTLGRTAAHQALMQLGVHDEVIIGRAKDGAAIWPAGIVGSLTHASNFAAAAASHQANYRSIGLDLEVQQPNLDLKIADRIASADELAWIHSDPDCAALRTLMLFSAKESFYKALRPLVGIFFGFEAVELRWEPVKSQFHAVLKIDLNPEFSRNREFSIAVHLHDQLIISSIALANDRH